MSPDINNTLINICHGFQCTISLKRKVFAKLPLQENLAMQTLCQKLVFKDITTIVH